jgi:hypothetical protein|tara:strand:+ start:3795 stop:3995 length:201 start_codon:yes stop_codon:yes gene_type:complete
MPQVDTAGDTSRWISKCGPASGTENLSTLPPAEAGGSTGVAVVNGEAVATGAVVGVGVTTGVGVAE